MIFLCPVKVEAAETISRQGWSGYVGDECRVADAHIVAAAREMCG
jgi:hypothetical protein